MVPVNGLAAVLAPLVPAPLFALLAVDAIGEVDKSDLPHATIATEAATERKNADRMFMVTSLSRLRSEHHPVMIGDQRCRRARHGR